MRSQLLATVALAALGLTSCAAPLAVELDGDRSVDISKWRTWSWSPAAASAIDRAAGIAMVDAQVRRATASTLAEKGLRLVPRDQADAWLDYAIDVQRVGRPDGAGGLDMENHGTLMIKMRDTRTDRIGWLGTATGIPRDMDTLEERRATATRVTHRLLKHYPKR